MTISSRYAGPANKTMKPPLSLEALWELDSRLDLGVFQKADYEHLPPAALAYLTHSITEGTPLASAVRLKMQGTIKVKKRWLPFTGEQVIRWHQGFIWQASAYSYGVPIRGSARLIAGEGSTEWRLFGLFPVMQASGPEETRSAIGRAKVESVWLPSVLCHPEVTWTQTDRLHPHARITIQHETSTLALDLEATGRVKSTSLFRWGNPERIAFPYVSFGGILEEECTFDGYTIPTNVRIGWHFGTERFESEGEFFRATIDNALFR